MRMIYLVGYSGSTESKSALSLARDHAAGSGAQVIVVASTRGGSKETPEEIKEKEDNLLYAENFLKEKNIACECYQIARGALPGEDLVSYAEENDVDQIYVGIEIKSKTQKILIKSNAQYVILNAPCPVVTVNR
ncbi:MAG: universal stress protein [Desulfobacterales bacterium]|nr:universal stress protein [Desulfobacterales bacterium]